MATGSRPKRLQPATLLLVAGLVLLALELGLGALLLLWPEPPFHQLPGQQLSDSRAE